MILPDEQKPAARERNDFVTGQETLRRIGGRTFERAVLGFGFQAYFNELGPQFARHEQAVTRRIIGDAIQYVRACSVLLWREQVVKINDTKNYSGGGIDAHDVIGQPNIAKIFPLIYSNSFNLGIGWPWS